MPVSARWGYVKGQPKAGQGPGGEGQRLLAPDFTQAGFAGGEMDLVESPTIHAPCDSEMPLDQPSPHVAWVLLDSTLRLGQAEQRRMSSETQDSPPLERAHCHGRSIPAPPSPRVLGLVGCLASK